MDNIVVSTAKSVEYILGNSMGDMAIKNLKLIAEGSETRFIGDMKIAELYFIQAGVLQKSKDGKLSPTSEEIREQILSIREKKGRVKLP